MKAVKRISIRPEATLIFEEDEDGYKFVSELQAEEIDVVVEGKLYSIAELVDCISLREEGRK